ncbi:MAG: hypothetical protein KAT74_00260, partial [Candidatus Cloacimonetes bacterium]|nr:hypothetical protein [Candidatus Cloacimonadota bacterium]
MEALYLPEFDLRGALRIYNEGIIDQGAYEFGNNMPSDIYLSSNTVPENEDPGYFVGTFTTEDIDEEDTHTHTLVPGEGDDDNDKFEIIGDELFTTVTFNYEVPTRGLSSGAKTSKLTAGKESYRLEITPKADYDGKINSGTRVGHSISRGKINIGGSKEPVIPENRGSILDADINRQGGDNIGSATVISGLPYTDTGTTMGYTDDYDEVCPYTGSTSPDVVYAYTPSGDESINIDLCNSWYDTKVYVYENGWTPGSPYACNDDYYYGGDPCGSYVSAIFNLDIYGGNTYYIVVDGYGGDYGDYEINIDVNILHPAFIRVRSTDSGLNNLYIEKEFVIAILDVNDAPTIVLPDNFSFAEDTQLIEDFIPYLFDEDLPPDLLTLSVTGNTEVQVAFNALEVTFTATLNWFGTENLTFTVNDNEGRAIASDNVDVIVTPVNDPPILDITGTFEADEDLPSQVYDFSVFCSQTWGETDVLTLTADNSAHIDVNINDFDVVFQSSMQDWNGTEDIVFYLNDNIARLMVADTIQVTVNPLNDPPILIITDTFEALEDEPSVVYNFGIYCSQTWGENDSLSLTAQNSDHIDATF